MKSATSTPIGPDAALVRQRFAETFDRLVTVAGLVLLSVTFFVGSPAQRAQSSEPQRPPVILVVAPVDESELHSRAYFPIRPPAHQRQHAEVPALEALQRSR